MSINEWPTLLNRFGDLNPKWKIGSKVIVPTVGLISKFWAQCLNSTRIHNHLVLLDTLAKHYNNDKKRPLITISNHSSCLDDPLIWGPLIPMKWQFNAGRHRWSAAAQEICFTNAMYSMFFSLGKTFPIIRGKGIYQPAMDYALNLLKNGEWLHFFPEGKVVVTPKESDTESGSVSDSRSDSQLIESNGQEVKPSYELKWGLARLILDHVLSDNTCNEVEVLPFYHLGMDDILPTKEPYIPLVFKRTTFYIREEGPILFDKTFLSTLLDDISSDGSKERRIKIMRFFETEMNSLKDKAIKLHKCLDNNVVSVDKQN